MRPWTGLAVRIVGAAAHGLQWGHGLAAVDGVVIQPQALSDKPCFNGATALRPWTAPAGASSRRWPSGFNGATALRPWTGGGDLRGPEGLRWLQWGHGLAAVDGCRKVERVDGVNCFNGATALRPWTGIALRRIRFCLAKLQWGHGLAAVDGRSPTRSTRWPGASMGPRPCGRGRLALRGLPVRCRQASMGPRPCGRGRRRAGGRHARDSGASMGPRPCGRGRPPAPCRAAGPQHASMGPRPCGRGRQLGCPISPATR